MSNDYAWRRYEDLQQRCLNASLGDYGWGLESALNYLLEAIENGTVPTNPAELDAVLKRTIASGGRLQRSRSLALKKWMTPPESVPTSAAAEATIELARIERAVTETDREVLLDAGEGYTACEIARRHASTPGAIRVRLSRLRLKLAANGRSAGHPRKFSSPAANQAGHRRAILAAIQA